MEGEREGEKHQHARETPLVASCTRQPPNQGSVLQPRHVP